MFAIVNVVFETTYSTTEKMNVLKKYIVDIFDPGSSLKNVCQSFKVCMAKCKTKYFTYLIHVKDIFE